MSTKYTSPTKPQLTSESIHTLHFLHNFFHFPVITALIVSLFETTAKKESDGLPDAGRETSAVFLDDIITIISGLPVDELHQHFSLVN